MEEQIFMVSIIVLCASQGVVSFGKHSFLLFLALLEGGLSKLLIVLSINALFWMAVVRAGRLDTH